jgi:Rrf2 family nitric oxide-sensitive transcriptional repressor|tara:strand:- start:33 stop:464 length:432 start_codon:yes stop_codon:yes gene_type:complete
MNINLHTDYAFRVLLYLAVHTSDRVTIAEISAFFSISHEHLRKTVHSLSKASYIRTYLGRSGGMELLQDPSAINLKEIFLTFETEKVIDCNKNGCILSTYCTLNHVFDRAYLQFLQVLSEYTLADLINDSKMRENLSLPIRII